MSFGPPQIFPPVPINKPGALGSNAAPVTSPGTITEAFQQPVAVPPLWSNGVGLTPPSSADPVFVPPNATGQELP